MSKSCQKGRKMSNHIAELLKLRPSFCRYAVPPEHGKRLERLAQGKAPIIPSATFFPLLFSCVVFELVATSEGA